MDADRLARRLGLPHVVLFDEVGSTLDVAHSMASGAHSGTLILADRQSAGRGRFGRRWTSLPQSGVWLTLIERPTDARGLDVLALRCGLYAAEALDELAGTRVGVKWPNDLQIGGCKLAGTLIETRWRGTAPEWIAIGFGLNVAKPMMDTAIGLAPGATRLEALDQLVPALRRAAAASRHLSADELARWSCRDVSLGQRATAPAVGTVDGITADGALRITSVAGVSTAHRTGSLTLDAGPICS